MASISKATKEMWSIWHYMNPFWIGDEVLSSFDDFVDAALCNGHPIQLARLIVCIAFSVQQMSPSESHLLDLPMPTDELLEHYVSTVRELVTSNDSLVGSVDGIDCLQMMAKFHLNIGQPRKGWLVVRQLVTHAQLLGLHRDAEVPGQTAEPPVTQRRKRLWRDVYQCDHMVSVLLGLPCCIRDKSFESELEIDPGCFESIERQFRLRLAVICGHMSDLPEADVASSLGTVQEVDQRLERLAASTPDAWWDVTSMEGMRLEAHFERLLVQFWYHHVKIILHLPLMLRSASEPRYDYSRLMCLNSAREMIKRYDLLRVKTGPTSYICKMVDFEAFTATVILLLGLFGVENASWVEDRQDKNLDWTRVDRMIELMRSAASEAGGIVNVQALKVLEILRSGRDRGSDVHDSKSVAMVIPFFGTVTTAPGSKLKSIERGQGADQANLMAPLTPDSIRQGDRGQPDETSISWDPPLSTPGTTMEPLLSFSHSLPPTLPASDSWSGGPGIGVDDAFLQNAMNFDLDQDWTWFLDAANLR